MQMRDGRNEFFQNTIYSALYLPEELKKYNNNSTTVRSWRGKKLGQGKAKMNEM